MAKIPIQVIESIKRFKEKISSDLAIKKIILFGSYAKGNFSEDSDIDL